MEHEQNKSREGEPQHRDHPKLQIIVNGKPVTIDHKELTGRQIKEAAIGEGVKIDIDFVLFEDLSDGKPVVVKDDQLVKVHEHQNFEAVPNKLEIIVNGKPVTIDHKELTGRQIKEAAIAQGVKIEIDFVLFEDLSNGKQVVVKDDQLVKVHEHQRFEAITNDDNS
jgi:predicted PP-loop superfamily ATPase